MRNKYDFRNARRGAAIASPGKTRITIMLDNDVIDAFRARAEAQGTGYQTAINEALRAHLANGDITDDSPVTVRILREVLRQERQA